VNCGPYKMTLQFGRSQGISTRRGLMVLKRGEKGPIRSVSWSSIVF